MRTIFRKVKYWLYIIYLAIKWIPRTNLGDHVFYRDKRYSVSNGVVPSMWNLVNNNEDPRYIEDVCRYECKKVQSISNYWRSFTSGYRFYMQCWFGIWVNEGIKPWMRNCKIW